MRIENIEIFNFRQYRNLTFQFPKVSGQGDLHIIYAKNGVGKTNVLNAITWCLYDTEMHLGDKSTASEILNNQSVYELRQHLSENGNNLGEASVCILLSSDDGSEKLSFKRVGKFNVTKENVLLIESKFTIMHFCDGEWNSIDSEEDTTSFVKKYVPEEIHDYIFFDGEHLENYFKSGQSTNIKNGIEELTQAKILEKAENSFNQYLVGVLNPQIAKSSAKDVSEAQKKLDGIQEAIDASNGIIDGCTSQILEADDEIANLEGIINGHQNVSDKTKRLKEVEDAIDINKEAIAKKKADMIVFAREYVTYFSLYPSIKSLYRYIQEQDNSGKLPPRIDKFLLDSIEKHKHCCVCDQDLGEHSMTFIEELKKELEVSSETSALLNKSVAYLRQYLTKLSQYAEKRDFKLGELEKLHDEYRKLCKEERQLNIYLSSIPNSEEIAESIEKRKAFRKLRDEIIARRGAEEAHKKELDEQYVEQDKLLKSLIDKNEQLEKISKQAEYCKKCRNILKEVRLDLLSESRREMEQETFSAFTKLLWKKESFSKVEIREDYTFHLLDMYGTQTLGSCSAAERALLALSFTLALQKVSMHDSLLFIDTPIGRVDDDNRINFINTLCEIAKSKQVILTFTPTEYDEKVRGALHNRYCSFNQLAIEDGVTIKI